MVASKLCLLLAGTIALTPFAAAAKSNSSQSATSGSTDGIDAAKVEHYRELLGKCYRPLATRSPYLQHP
jgi:hypothetical protein